jgi:ElaB/YqjD/DUF883 family membrane-anchored ribosome-binding protein
MANQNPSFDEVAKSAADASERIKEKLSDTISEIFDGDPKAQAAEFGKKLGAEATVFIKNNPWAAVLGAAAIGYLLGASRGGRK